MKHGPNLLFVFLVCFTAALVIPLKVYVLFGAASGFLLIPMWRLLFDRTGLKEEGLRDMEEIKNITGAELSPSTFFFTYFSVRYVVFGVFCTILWPVMILMKIMDSISAA